MPRWSWKVRNGFRTTVPTLAIAAVWVAIAGAATAGAEICGSLAERYASAPHQARLAALEVCLAAEWPDPPLATALPTATARPLPVEPWVRQPTRARGEWPAAEPWTHTSESWPEESW